VSDTMGTAPAPRGAARGRRQIPTWYYIVGAAGIGVSYFLWQRHKANQAAATAVNQVAQQPSNASSDGTQAGTYPATQADLANLEAQIMQMQGAPSTTSSASGVAYSPPTGEVLSGGGYSPTGMTAPTTIISNPQGSGYQLVGNLGQAQGRVEELVRSGAQLYFQPTPGIFTRWVPGKTGLPKGTPLFVKAV
jgi:hypothetical protein